MVCSAAFITTTVVLMVDNFSYTLFQLGIVSTVGYERYFYLIAIALTLVIVLYWYTRQVGGTIESQRLPWYFFLATALVLLSIGTVIVRMSAFDIDHEEGRLALPKREKLPNIIFFSSDGIDADQMSAYGYERETTPNLDRLLNRALIVENAVTNCGRSTGSVVSMLTGKLPATTKVIFPPHVLRGRDAFQHLPGILKSIGYQTFEESVRYYVDARDLNMRNAYDVVNQRVSSQQAVSFLPLFVGSAFSAEMLLIQKLIDRIWERALHLSGVQEMVNPFRSYFLNPGKTVGLPDKPRIRRAIAFMEKAAGPFFVHLHLDESHCCTFRPRIRRFSAEKKKQRKGEGDDFYDDAILTSDDYFGKLTQWLEKTGKLDNTLIVYTSDHNRGFVADRRIPLIILFPRGEHSGRIQQTAQLLDVFPTVLDYLHVPLPQWIEGKSLLRASEISPLRTIYSVSGVELERGKKVAGRWLKKLVDAGPPLYGVKKFVATVCHKTYAMDVHTGELAENELPQHTAPCAEEQMLGKAEVTRKITEYLEGQGFRLPFRKHSGY